MSPVKQVAPGDSFAIPVPITAGTTTNIVGKNITSTVSLASPQITSHGGGTVSLQALTGSPNVTNDSGDINVTGTVGDGTTTSVYMSAGQTIGVGNIKISGAVSTTSASFTSVRLLAGGNISTGAITSPQVGVFANKFGITGTSTFLLGGGGTNGISGAVTAKNTTGGGGYIDVENGYQTGTGNMTVAAGDVVETGTTGNFIGLYAHGGTLILPGSKITAGGPLSQALLVGTTVNFVNGTNISSDYLTGGSAHSVVIEADTIHYAGSSVVTANGAGQDSSNAGAVFVQGYTSGTTKVQFVGTAGAKLSLGADGDHTYTQVYADAISFATGAATLHSQGTTDHGVYLTNVSDTSANDSLSVPSGSLTLDASGKNGNGGVINIDVYNSNLSAPTFVWNVSGSTTNNGQGGTITYYANSTTFPKTSALTATANGQGSGIAGTIQVRSAGTMDLTKSTMSAKNVGGTGAGGSIEIANLTSLTVRGTMTADGGNKAGSAAPGGTINLHNLGYLNSSTATLSVNGGGSGLGGTVTLNQTGSSAPMDLDDVTITASGDPAGSGSGNAINISVPSTTIYAAGMKLKANATGTANAFGGSINITTVASQAGQIDLTQANTSISATGATKGAGGSVIVSNTIAFDVNTVINVNAGSGVLANTSIFAGSVQLNNVPCRQYNTGYTWPSKYWNCVNPASPSATDQIPPQVASSLPNNLSTTTLQGVNPYLYVMTDSAQYNKFFTATLDPTVAGFTAVFQGKTRPLYTAIFENATLQGTYKAVTPQTWLHETTTHEMGHSIDASGATLASGSTAYGKEVTDDMAYLDGAGLGQPCTVGALYNGGPFVGLVDIVTGAQFCSNGILNNPNGRYTNPATHTLYSNSQIALHSTPNLNQGTIIGQNGWVEPYAQSFAYQAFAKGETYPGGYFDTTADGLFHQGFYQCIQATAASLIGQTYSTTYSCN